MMMITEANRLEKTEEMINGNWDMDSDAVRYEWIEDSPRDPLEITEDPDSLPSPHISHMQLYMVDNTVETENARGISETQAKSQGDLVTPSMAKASPSKSPVKKQPTVCLPKHIPVVQVSSYKSIRRNASEPPKLTRIRQPQNLSDPTFSTHRPLPTLARTMSAGQVQGGLGMRMPNIKLERDLSTTPEGSASTSSKEMLAVNVLSGMCYQQEDT